MKNYNGIKLKSYENKWIALSPDRKRILSSGLTLQNAREKLDEKKRSEAIFLKVLPVDANYAPFLYEV